MWVHRALASLVLNRVRSGDSVSLKRVGRASGAGETLADPRAGSLDLAAHAHHARAVRVFEIDGEVVEDVAVLRIGALLPAADADRSDRMAAHHPVGDVDVVHVLFDDVVAGEPGECSQLRICHSASLQVGWRSWFHRPPWFQNTWPLTTSPMAPPCSD